MILQFLPLEPDELLQNIIFLSFAVVDDLFYNMIILPQFLCIWQLACGICAW